PPQQPHYGPPQQQPLSPPIPFGSKPQTPQPPAIPGRPSSFQPPPGPPPSQPQVYWQPSFSASTPVTANFRHELGAHGWGNNEKQDYTSSPANSFHHNDKLIIRALVQNGTYTSARLTSHQTLSRPRGYLTATILPPVARGIWPAYWMLPQAPFSWPTDGEIDIFESSNGACKTLSCLHWGHFNGPDHDKHRVVETQLPDIRETPHTYGFSWSEEEGIPEWRGRLLWYIDGRPVMKANIPKGTRRMEEFTILLNIAMGGTLCQGVLPEDGYYDMVVGDMRMCEEPPGGWTEFERAWASSPEGKGM
ncbi:glycoside hydrolase family 16 protein, partial [Sporormia fimetaria CBS 119925]